METVVRVEGKRSVQVLSDIEAIGQEAASLFVNASRNSVAIRRRFVVAISGGSTPRRLYTLLSTEPYRDQSIGETSTFSGRMSVVSPKEMKRAISRPPLKGSYQRSPYPMEIYTGSRVKKSLRRQPGLMKRISRNSSECQDYRSLILLFLGWAKMVIQRPSFPVRSHWRKQTD